jgi:hypothetical protein
VSFFQWYYWLNQINIDIPRQQQYHNLVSRFKPQAQMSHIDMMGLINWWSQATLRPNVNVKSSILKFNVEVQVWYLWRKNRKFKKKTPFLTCEKPNLGSALPTKTNRKNSQNFGKIYRLLKFPHILQLCSFQKFQI